MIFFLFSCAFLEPEQRAAMCVDGDEEYMELMVHVMHSSGRGVYLHSRCSAH